MLHSMHNFVNTLYPHWSIDQVGPHQRPYNGLDPNAYGGALSIAAQPFMLVCPTLKGLAATLTRWNWGTMLLTQPNTPPSIREGSSSCCGNFPVSLGSLNGYNKIDNPRRCPVTQMTCSTVG